MNYQEFKEDFETSGMTQSAYGKQIGKSASMVCYYLKRAGREFKPSPSFSKLELVEPEFRMIRIKTASGLEIEIPL